MGARKLLRDVLRFRKTAEVEEPGATTSRGGVPEFGNQAGLPVTKHPKLKIRKFSGEAAAGRHESLDAFIARNAAHKNNGRSRFLRNWSRREERRVDASVHHRYVFRGQAVIATTPVDRTLA